MNDATRTAPSATAAGGTTGAVNYLAPSVRPSLYRNGEVLTRRDPDGSDGERIGIVVEPYEMAIGDARLAKGGARPTLEANGFELLERPLADPGLDFLHHDPVVREYYGECAEIVREATGAARVFAFDHNVRSAGGKQAGTRIEGGQEVQRPARMEHGDYTLTSAPERLRQLARPASGNDTLRSVLGDGQALLPGGAVEHALEGGGRFAIVNLWRNIAPEPVATYPLALCDAQTVEPEDLVVFEIHYSDRVGENYFAKHAERHRWHYYPGMTRDEALLIKQWDSAGPLARSHGANGDGADPGAPCTFSFHTAFRDPATPPDAPDRWSIEVRCVVLYD